LFRLLEALFSSRALICFCVSTVPPIAAAVIGRNRDSDSESLAFRAGFERRARVQRPPPSATLT